MREAVSRMMDEGRTLEAEQLLRVDVDDAVKRHGKHSLQHAQALFDLSALFVNMGADPDLSDLRNPPSGFREGSSP